VEILYLTTVLPGKIPGGGEIATKNFISAFEMDGHSVRLLGFCRENDNHQGQCVEERRFVSAANKIQTAGWLLQSVFMNTSYGMRKFYSNKYAEHVLDHLSTNKIGCVVIEHSQLSWMSRLIKNNYPRIPLIFNSQNVEFDMYSRLACQAKGNDAIKKILFSRESVKLFHEEISLIKDSRQVWCLTKNDCELYKKHVPDKEYRVFNIPGSMSLQPRNEQSTLTRHYDVSIIGSWTWMPNAIGLRWFVQHVLPYLPDKVSVSVAGAGAEDILRDVRRVNYVGRVESSYEFLRRSRVIVIPSMEGGGIQIKTLDAIAMGLPVVATSVACRGLDNLPQHIKVTDDPAMFANYIVQYLVSNSVFDCQKSINWYANRVTEFNKQVSEAISSIDEGSTIEN